MSNRIRVYKRDDSGPGGDDVFSPSGYLWERPWMVGPTPEDSRKTCWPTWDRAMLWATDTEYRRAWLDQEALEDEGW